jgi:aminopeptidase N
VVIDFKDPSERVHGVFLDGAEVEWQPLNDHVVIAGSLVSSGEPHEVTISFEAGDEALNRNPDFLYTLFVPDRAHFSLQIFDQPNLKAPFSVTLRVPEGWVAVSNGVDEEEPNEGGGTTYRFAETRPIPPYLLAFAVGAFEIEVGERDGRTFRMYHRETDRAKVVRNAPAIFDLHRTALDWLEEYTGIPYPYGKFDFVLIPSFQYGGMEHPGSIYYRQTSLMLDESATQAQTLGRASLIAHETAHQWFGDLVTMAWFNDVWTKEVFANFMAAKIVYPSFPDINHDLRFFLAHHDAAYAVDRTPGANPIRQPLENLKEAGTLYGAIIYQKAPIVMRQLELMIGADPFRDGMRTYLSRYRDGNATWPELIDILDALTDEDLGSWSRVWVEESGRPRVAVLLREDAEGALEVATITQEDMSGAGRLWPQQLEVLMGYGDSITRVSVRLEGASFELDEWIGRPRPDYVLPNGKGVEYGHFHLDASSLRYLSTNLTRIPDPLVRGIAWVTLRDAVLEGELKPRAWYDLLIEGVGSESEEQNVQRVLGYLGSTLWSLLLPEERELLADRTESALWNALQATSRPTLKSALFGAWRDVVISTGGTQRLRAIWSRRESVPGLTLSESDFTRLAAGLALRGVADAEEILDEQLSRISDPDRRDRFVFTRPALSADPAVRESFFESLRDPANREREPWALTGLRYLHHPLRVEHAERFVIPSLEMVLEIQRTGDIFFPTRWLRATLGSHNDPEVAAEVRAFLDSLASDYPPRLRGKILQEADVLFRAARILHSVDP